jgi:aspartate racemase
MPATGVVGILGGMGPAATAQFYTTLIRLTPAASDQEHLRVVMWADPTVPDRNAAAAGKGPDPTPWLLRGARILEDAGADLIAVPCNAAHAFLSEVRRAVAVRILDLVDETVRRVTTEQPDVRRVGLLATDGTLRTGLYARAFAARDIQVLTPDPDDQERLVMGSVYAVKVGRTGPDVRSEVRTAVETLVARGCELIVVACTELPLVLDPVGLAVPLVDTTETLALAAIEQAISGGYASGRHRSAHT